MGPTWVPSAPGGPHVGPMNLAIKVYIQQWKMDTGLYSIGCVQQRDGNDGLQTTDYVHQRNESTGLFTAQTLCGNGMDYWIIQHLMWNNVIKILDNIALSLCSTITECSTNCVQQLDGNTGFNSTDCAAAKRNTGSHGTVGVKHWGGNKYWVIKQCGAVQRSYWLI